MYYLDPKYEKWYYEDTHQAPLFELDKPIIVIKWGVYTSHIEQGVVGASVPTRFIIDDKAGNNKA